MPNSVINNLDCSKTMILALQEVGRKRAASGCERLMMGLKNELQLKQQEQELEKVKMRVSYQRRADLDMTSLKSAKKSFLVLLALTCLNIGCFGINKVASSSSPTNIEQSFTDSNKLLLLSHQQPSSQQQQLQQQASQQPPQNHLQDQQTPVSNFDASNYRSIYEAIRNHPELREVSSSVQSELR